MLKCKKKSCRLTPENLEALFTTSNRYFTEVIITGHSMAPLYPSGTKVQIELGRSYFHIHEPALCVVNGKVLFHFIKDSQTENGITRLLICNANGKENGWIPSTSVYGRPTSRKYKLRV